MTEILYNLKHRLDKKDDITSLIYQEKDHLYHILIEIEKKNNLLIRYLKKSFEYCTIKKGHSPIKALLEYGEIYSSSNYQSKDFRLVKIKNQFGVYHPRIYRPFIELKRINLLGDSSEKINELEINIFKYLDYIPYNDKALISSLNQLAFLKEMLLSILNTVSPTKNNLKVYGTSIKNLLVLACIEVETQLKAIYKSNEAKSKVRYTTKDYVVLKNVLHLDKYWVNLPSYPDLKQIQPFSNWNDKNPTTSIKWYDSYNAVKHNSDVEFSKANLFNSIQAVCAVAILIKAQYGDRIPLWQDILGSFFEVNNNIKWKTTEKLLPPFKGQLWIRTPLGL